MLIEKTLNRGVEKIIDKKHLKERMERGEKLRIKLGIDPTGPKLHIGRATQLWKLKDFQELGHQIVLIIGDFTALVGDASDKTSQRKALKPKEIEKNMKDYKEQIGKVLDLKKTEFRKNSEWLDKLKLKEIVSLAMNFTAQQMIQRRNFKERWDNNNPIGLQELLYPIMQGYDSVAVKADLEIGGSDQLFNLKVGREIQRIFDQSPQDIMILEMLYGLDGRKMSTSWENVINITDEPEEMYGKVMSMKDELIESYFEIATRIPLKEIKEEIKKFPREAKARLAKEITKMYHGTKKAEKAEKEFNRVFKEKKNPTEIPEFKVSQKEIFPLDLIYNSGLASSKSQAKRLIMEKAVKIDGKVLENWKEKVKLKEGMIIRAGKRKFIKIKI